MPLTPEDVKKKTFTPVRLREGYDMGEVDQFLDDVEVELTRLLEENADLRAQLTGETSSGSVSAEAAEATTAPVSDDEPQAPTPTKADGADPASAPPQLVATTTGEAASAAARLLEIATNNADQLVSEAQRDAERIRTEAKSEAERRDTQSRALAERLEADARGRAERLESEMSQQRQHHLGNLEREKQGLAQELEELRAFEREYRSRLRTYFENQLRALDGEDVDDMDEAPRTPAVDGATSGRLSELLGEPPS
jgi:DivIVA domain-containing protein